MTGDQNNLLLEEVHKAAQMGLEAASIIMKKTEEPQLKDYLHSQCKNYAELVGDIERKLYDKGEQPKQTSVLDKAMLWGSIQMNTLTDLSSTKIAELMINGSTMGIVDMTKKLNEYQEAENSTRQFCKTFIENEENHIQHMKEFL